LVRGILEKSGLDSTLFIPLWIYLVCANWGEWLILKMDDAPAHFQPEQGNPPLAPPVLELRHQLDHFTSSLNRISMRSDYLIGLADRLKVYESAPNQIVEGISALQGNIRKKGRRCLSSLHARMGSAASNILN